MPAPEALLDLYLHLALASEEQSRPLQRDKFLVLAAGLAHESGFPVIAEECRQRILASNPSHLFKSFSTTSEAFESDEVRHYANQLLRTYPFEKAEFLLVKARSGGYAGDHGHPELAPKRVPPPKGQTAERPAKSSSSRRRPSGDIPAAGATGDFRPISPDAGDSPESITAFPAEPDAPTIVPLKPRPRRPLPYLYWAWIIIAFSFGAIVGGLAVLSQVSLP